MADLKLKLDVSEYRCDPCSMRQGTVVRELVRMIPKSVVVFGKLVGPEYFCCPICFEPKFDVKTRRPVNGEDTPLAKDPGAGGRGPGHLRAIK